MKKIFQFIGITILIILTIPIIVIGPYAVRVRNIPASPENGYFADFYLYVSPKAEKLAKNGQTVTILVQPNNSGINSDDPRVHQRDAWFMGFERHKVADELGVVLLVPAFIRPGEDWQIYTHALDRDSLLTDRADLKRIDLQLIAMIDHARSILTNSGIQTDERIFIQGFSASGMFANRFTLLHPKRVKAAAIGSPGGFPMLPVASYAGISLPYPAGLADIEMLTGQPFNAQVYNAIPQLIYMGNLDDNDSLDFADGWEAETVSLVDRLFGADLLSRWQEAQAVYEESGANVQFLLIDGVGHDRKSLQKYATEFFLNILGQ